MTALSACEVTQVRAPSLRRLRGRYMMVPQFLLKKNPLFCLYSFMYWLDLITQESHEDMKWKHLVNLPQKWFNSFLPMYLLDILFPDRSQYVYWYSY